MDRVYLEDMIYSVESEYALTRDRCDFVGGRQSNIFQSITANIYLLLVPSNNNMEEPDYTAEWGLSPKLENLDHTNFGLRNHFKKDLDESDFKVLGYISSIGEALQSHVVEVDGTVQVYESEATTERSFGDILRDESANWTPQQTHGGGIPQKGEEYFDMLKASNEALNAIRAYDGEEVDEEFDMYDIEFEESTKLTEEIPESNVHILGASVEYETESGKVEFTFHSPSMYFENFKFNQRRRDRFERLRDEYPFGIYINGNEDLRETVRKASSDFEDKWKDQFKNKICDLLT